jgi:predicted HicB family RNase H-like nuclease
MEISEQVARLQAQRQAIRFSELLKICREYFGEPRIKGSHHIFKTPWAGDPRLNLQSDKGKAKPYQVEQVISELRKLDKTTTDEKSN